jgi:flagellar basal body-associated protein FliL
MALHRTDAPSDAADASAETAPIAVPAAAGGFRAWLPLLFTVIAMPVLAWLTTIYVLLPRMQKGLGIQPVAAAEANKKGAGVARRESFTMSKLLVNVSGTMGARYLLVSISITGNDSEFKNKIEAVEPQLRDMACGVLRVKTLADLEKPTACNLIRGELISGFNTILGGQVVQDIYFTEFAIQ